MPAGPLPANKVPCPVCQEPVWPAAYSGLAATATYLGGILPRYVTMYVQLAMVEATLLASALQVPSIPVRNLLVQPHEATPSTLISHPFFASPLTYTDIER